VTSTKMINVHGDALRVEEAAPYVSPPPLHYVFGDGELAAQELV
jgi:hypothetical protein